MRRCRLDSADHRPLPPRTEREGVESEGVREFGTDSVYDDCFRGPGKGSKALSPTAVPIVGSPGYALWRGGLPLPPCTPSVADVGGWCVWWLSGVTSPCGLRVGGGEGADEEGGKGMH